MILKELREERKITSALEWVKAHLQELEAIESDLLFSLHCTEFSHILKSALDIKVEQKRLSHS